MIDRRFQFRNDNTILRLPRGVKTMVWVRVKKTKKKKTIIKTITFYPSANVGSIFFQDSPASRPTKTWDFDCDLRVRPTTSWIRHDDSKNARTDRKFAGIRPISNFSGPLKKAEKNNRSPTKVFTVVYV